MKLGQLIYDADNPEHTGELIYIGATYAKVGAPDGGYWFVHLSRIRQGNGRGLSKRRQVQRKKAAARKYQPMSARMRKELRAAMAKPAFAETPSHRVIAMLARLLDDVEYLNAKLKEAKG